MKFFRALVITLILLIGLITGALFYLSSKYGEIVQSIAISAMNEYLKSEVKVGSIGVGKFEDLPYFSLSLNDVIIYEPSDYSTKPDTLIAVKRVSLQFDLSDMIAGNYTLKKVGIENGHGRFIVDAKGASNYEFWKTIESDNDTAQFRFSLEEVELEDIDFQYIDHTIDLFISTEAQEAELNGDFTDKDLELVFNGSFNSSIVEVSQVRYVRKRDLLINSGIRIDHESSRIEFLQGEILVDNQFVLQQKGSIQGNKYSFDVFSDQIKVNQLNSLVPRKYAGYQEFYQLYGDVKLNCSVRGDGQNKLPHIYVEFDVNNGKMRHIESELEVTNISMNGIFTNGKARSTTSSSIVLNNLQAQFIGKPIGGSLELRDFNKLALKAKVNGELDLVNAIQFVEQKTLAQLRGLIHFDLSTEVVLSKLQLESPDLSGSRITGSLQVSDFSLVPANVPLTLESFDGKLEFKNREVQFENLSGKVQSSEVVLNGKLYNLILWLFDTKSKNNFPVVVNASLKADKFNASEFMFSGDEEGEGSDDGLMENIEFRLKAEIGEFRFREFEASHVETNIFLGKRKFEMRPLHMDALDGIIRGGLSINRKLDNTFRIELESGMTQVDVSDLFYSFRNFGQREITSENLRGKANVVMKLNGIADEELNIISNTVKANSHLVINDGQLLDYSSLKAVSDYFRKNLVLKGLFRAEELEENLMEINFDKLENEIMVENSEVIIPRMFAGNDLMGLYAEGTQSFDGYMDYRLEFDISELLLRDSKKAQSSEGIIAGLDHKGIQVFLRMYGPLDSIIIEVDKERKREFKREKRQEEANEFKSALNAEFGLFKRDSSVSAPDPKTVEYEIEWEEADKKGTPDTSKIDTTKKQKKPLGGLFKNTEQNEEEEFDFGDDDDF